MARRPARDPELAAAFGARVRARRRELGLTQEQVAERAGLYRATPGHVEQGRLLPDLLTVVRLAHALEVDVGALVTGLRLQ